MKHNKSSTTARAALQQPCNKVKRVIGRPFPKGTSGNPSGKRPGSVSPTAALKRALTRGDADAIAAKLISCARAGDAAALRILLDRCDGPLNGPLALSIASTSHFEASGTGVVVIVDNGRGDRLPSNDDDDNAVLPPEAPPAIQDIGEECEPPMVIEGEAIVISGSEFLKSC
jgi:Family of unknown function (DUF5681)